MRIAPSKGRSLRRFGTKEHAELGDSSQTLAQVLQGSGVTSLVTRLLGPVRVTVVRGGGMDRFVRVRRVGISVRASRFGFSVNRRPIAR